MKQRKKYSSQRTRNLLLLFAINLLLISLPCPSRAQDVESNELDQTSNDIVNPDEYRKNDQYHYIASPSSQNAVTEITETSVTGEKVLRMSESPYQLRTDLVVERGAKLMVEPGVVVYFAPMVGITVKGVIKAIGTANRKITFTSIPNSGYPDLTSIDHTEAGARLVDGPSPVEGRLQIYHHGKWRSVCSNSRNWTIADYETVCRQMGFKGGRFWNWMERAFNYDPRLLYEDPACTGNERNLFECRNWRARQLGSGVCDYHADIGIQCLPLLQGTSSHWAGLKFDFAQSGEQLSQGDTLFEAVSLSELEHVEIIRPGAGRNRIVTAGIQVLGVPPQLRHVLVDHSAYNGINVTKHDAAFTFKDVQVRRSKGYGVFVNSSYGLAHLEDCKIHENGADGVRYVGHDLRADERRDRNKILDFCTLPRTSNQIYPIHLSILQSAFAVTSKECEQLFSTKPGYTLTFSFTYFMVKRNESAWIEVFDGPTVNDRLLGKWYVRNDTRPQSLSSTREKLLVRFHGDARSEIHAYFKVTAGLFKAYDLNVTSSVIEDNGGRGIAVDNIRSAIHVHSTSISNNNHMAGLHILNGAGDINVTDSHIQFNQGDGINITYYGGNRNVSRSFLSSNQGYGMAVWLNETAIDRQEFVPFNQTSVLEYSEIVRNLETGFYHGNYSKTHWVNVTGNFFNDSMNDGVEILSGWFEQAPGERLKLQIGHNTFRHGQKIGVKLSPALNLDARIEYNIFEKGKHGQLLIRNKQLEEFRMLPVDILVLNNYFLRNQGRYVASLGLSAYSDRKDQQILFFKNFVRDNKITEPFTMIEEAGEGMSGEGRLSPRSRVAAPIVITTNNVDVFRNIISNPDSKYEVGSQFSDQSAVLNVTYNFLGTTDEEKVYRRIFHRKDRYNLAKIEYIPYLLHNSNPMTPQVFQYPMYVPHFYTEGTEKVGGEVDGQEELPPGSYTVDRDISIRPGGKLILKPGVVLNFAPSVGMMVAGKLEARGRSPNDIMFTLKREPIMTNDTEHEMEALKVDPDFNIDTETEPIDIPTTVKDAIPAVFTPVRLVGGQTEHEGRLQVHIDGRWGTVCDYNWNIVNAALVCHQLGLALNPKDWRLERSEVPSAGLDEDVILSNVRCTEHDNDITKCRAEHVSKNQFENSCSHDTDVGVRCYEGAWAGLRFGVLAEQADLQYVTIEKAGLFDYVTNTFKPAIQFDFARHNLDNVRVVENLHDGLGVIYSDIFSGGINNIRNSEFSKNKGNGISLKQLGLQVKHSMIKENFAAGIHHDPVLSALEQRELAGWFMMSPDSGDLDTDYKPIVLPRDNHNIDVDQWKPKYVITEKTRDNVEVTINARCQPGYVIGMQLLNPIENRSSEEIFIYDSQTGNLKSDIWLVKRDISTFPVTSSSYGIVIKYKSGTNALGGVVLVLSAIQAPAQTIYNRIVRGPVPTLTVTSSKIQKNFRGLTAMYYNRYLGDEGEHYLRKANESIKLVNCEITQNLGEAFYINSPFWDVHESNISEVHIHINNSRIIDNGRGVRQFSKDLRSSNNLFHYVMQDTTFERNGLGGLELSLPFVWQYNENFTHSIYLGNDTWSQNRRFGISIEGHFAEVNITGNRFIENDCLHGLVGFKGMEKKFRIDFNKFHRNNGKYMVEFKTDSQSEILGSVFALFAFNELENNTFNEREMFKPTFRAAMRAYHQKLKHPTCVIGFGGVQKVQIYRNVFRNNGQEYDLVAGVHSARLNNELLATENWWGSKDPLYIRTRIFDFEDWNNHAEVKWRPFLLEDDMEGSQSSSVPDKIPVDLSNVGGKITEDLVLYQRDIPYIINSDITIMPKVTLTIHGGVEMRFAPNVGILVLGTLIARGIDGGEILMHPIENVPKSMQSREQHTITRRGLESQEMHDGIRLCKDGNCTIPDFGAKKHHEGFLEFFNRTTLQWVPVCDRRFTERNAQVVCRELGFDPLDTFYGHDKRIEFHINSLTRIWSWLEPLECDGDENRLSDCPERLNGQVYGRRHDCKWDDEFVFVSCHGEGDTKSYWGGIRFANPEFEQNLYEHRIHDTHTHDTIKKQESFLEYVRIVRAGILHGEKSAAVQSINKNPTIRSVSIIDSAHHGINLVSPSDTIHLQHLNIRNSFGQGINAISLTGEGRESDESSFAPLKDLDLPYSLFSMIDICDTTKEITIEERVLVYYKYDNNPVNCVKIFNSAYRVKPLGFRLLQSNLFNHSKEYGRRDKILLYDGDIYNVSSVKIGQVEADGNDRKLFKTHEPTLSIRLIASGAPARHGFIAEVVTLPISGILFNRDAQHNISNSEIVNNVGGAIEYVSVGEVTPILTLERNRFMNNCRQLYGNFSTCESPISVDVQNMQSLYFRNNLVQDNQGGLFVRADSRGSATSLRAYIHHNLFTRNKNRPSLLIEGRQSSPYQEVTIYKNYFTQNKAGYKDVIGLRQVVSNFTYNYVHSNWGGRIVEISGFDKVRLPIYQTTSHNGFYDNVATDWHGRATIVAGTAGQHYIDNIFYNPDNDYEIITVNKSIFEVQQYWNSTIDLWKTKIDAAHNYWSYNETLAVGSRIRDRIDDPQLLEVQYLPLQMNNLSILDGGKCPPGWSMLIDTCYMYVGAPMTYQEAKDFCRSDNASLPFIRGDTTHLWLYLQRQMAHLRYTERVWIQDLDFINRCTSFVYRSVEFDDCEAKNPFVCEIDPKVFLKPIFWSADIVFISVVVLFVVAIVLLLILCCCWYSKTKHRQMQRFERRNSIRQSLRSLNSIDPQGSLRRRNY
ncbi:protein bark beetle isoform X2 [Culicoides brevitarsis]